MQWLSVALGGALGAMARFGVNALVYPVAVGKFPLGTLLVNVLGSIIIGICYVLIIERGVLPAELRNILMVGFLGAFTTFSTFSLDALSLWQNGHLVTGLLYVLGSVILCLAGAMAAMVITRIFL